ncbi:glycogen synthase GlgA [Aurantimonas sp. Leaf443]|uniref:glycogen synthase GlgA n=1 Tax=Aurantimonas sp. Leaf443 TaxID=1736378 RepID=UPI0006F68712|nr:glycogen synthase GlgA [Aurantimonas sp. Leaf443]KQT87986.1 glycogen synthase [Aurantimonas sp. Leaf443]
MTLKVLAVASELYPLVKTGGLADVAGALPLALSAHGVAVRTLMPAYPAVRAAVKPGARALLKIADLFGGPARLLPLKLGELELIVLDAPHLFDRPGGPYSGPTGEDHPDNWRRFAALAEVAARIGLGALKGWRPDIVHAHDWQAALAPVYLAFSGERRPKTVLTIHNLAFQGAFARAVFPGLGLPDTAWSLEGVEYYDAVGFLKGGLHAADALTTVSPTYAKEILTPRDGMGLDGLLNGRREALHGIVNGIDTDVWNPASDPAIAERYDGASLDRRVSNKRALEAEFNLAPGDGPILGIVSRLTWQKGLDLVAQACEALVAKGLRLVVVGSGERSIEGAFHAAHARHPRAIGVRIGYEEMLSHRLQAGADAILVPSRFEPCGLTQLCALRYGCVPVVSRVGGLADTVIDANFAATRARVATGIIFEPGEAGLSDALDRLVALYREPEAWQAMQARGLATDVSWTASAGQYAALYRDLLQK